MDFEQTCDSREHVLAYGGVTHGQVSKVALLDQFSQHGSEGFSGVVREFGRGAQKDGIESESVQGRGEVDQVSVGIRQETWNCEVVNPRRMDLCLCASYVRFPRDGPNEHERSRAVDE